MTVDVNSYRYFMSALDLSIERHINQVPNDGKYYIVHKGNIVHSFRSRKRAEEIFYQLVKDSGYKRDTVAEENIDPAQEALERYALSKDIFWAEGSEYKGVGEVVTEGSKKAKGFDFKPDISFYIKRSYLHLLCKT